MAKVHGPFLVPDGIDRGLRDCTQGPGDVGPTKGAERLLVLVAGIRNSWVGRRLYRLENKIGDEIRLIELVLPAESCESATVAHVAPYRVDHDGSPGGQALLNLEPLVLVDHE